MRKGVKKILDMYYFIALEKSDVNYNYRIKKVNGKRVVIKPREQGEIMECSVPTVR